MEIGGVGERQILDKIEDFAHTIQIPQELSPEKVYQMLKSCTPDVDTNHYLPPVFCPPTNPVNPHFAPEVAKSRCPAGMLQTLQLKLELALEFISQPLCPLR